MRSTRESRASAPDPTRVRSAPPLPHPSHLLCEPASGFVSGISSHVGSSHPDPPGA